MTISKDTVVSLIYTLKNEEGKILESSGAAPMVYLHGHRNIVPGLEKALDGLAVGASTKARITPEEGYGQYEPQLKFAMPREKLTGETPGIDSIVELQGPNGQTFVARVVEVKEDEVMLDANHPLAGQTLDFEVTVTNIRAANPEELSHGHVHGPGGHEH